MNLIVKCYQVFYIEISVSAITAILISVIGHNFHIGFTLQISIEL